MQSTRIIFPKIAYVMLILMSSALLGCSDAQTDEAPSSTASIFDTSISPSLPIESLNSGRTFSLLKADWKLNPMRLNRLVKAARLEGGIYWSGYNQVQIDAWCAAFTNEFDVPCSGRGVSARQIITSLAAESGAKQPKTDVAYLSMSQMAQYFDKGLASTTDWESLGINQSKIWSDGERGNAVGVILSQYTHFANTNYIQEMPATIFDWADPQYKGLICAPDFLLRAGNGFLGLLYDPEVMIQLHRHLIDENDMLVTNDCDALLVSGERPLTYMGYGLPYNLLDTGYIEPFWNPGLGANLFSHAIAADAPHPNAAKLFTAWSSSQRAADISWQSIRQGWPAYGTLHEVAPHFDYDKMVFESTDTYRLRSERTRYFQEKLFEGKR